MKTLKLDEGFLEDKEKEFNEKKNIIKKFINIMNKFELSDFQIEAEIGDYFYYYIDDDKKLVYDNQETKEKFKTPIFDTPIERLRELIDYCNKNNFFEIESIIAIYRDMDIFINILKKYDGIIKNVDSWMFLEQIDEENDENDTGDFSKFNTFEFQDMLLSRHPYMIDAFIDAINYDKDNYTLSVPIKLNEKIKKKYKQLFDDYAIRQNLKHFNI